MSKTLETRIIDFIQEHHLLTLATTAEKQPYCASCFYAYLEKENLFVFTSDGDTKHMQDVAKNKNVAATIALETKAVGKIRGIQIMGVAEELSGKQKKAGKKAYLKKFPFAILKQTTLWSIEPSFIKMTDNRLGFGKKITWQKKQ